MRTFFSIHDIKTIKRKCEKKEEEKNEEKKGEKGKKI